MWNEKTVPTPGSLSTSDSTSHESHEAAGDGQAQSGATAIGGPALRRLPEGQKHGFKVVFGNPDTGILNPKAQASSVARNFLGRDIQPDVALSGELDGIVQQIVENLCEPGLVAHQIERNGLGNTGFE